MIAIVRIIVDTAQAYLFLAIPVAFTFTHEKLKKKYLQILKCHHSHSNQLNSTAVEMQVIKSITGQNMVLKDEQEHYFNTLVAEWDAKLKT
uniref:Uncharacterized protein n=1 Tax=Panagrolaimus sp. PS1159 TaxID=55785 RepID=A0AC35G8A1_9BILA